MLLAPIASKGLSSPAGDISLRANAAASGDWAVRGEGSGRVGGLRCFGISLPSHSLCRDRRC
jgi:hypothetical protein